MQPTNSFVFYRSFYESLQDLDDKSRLQLYDAICSYSLDNRIADLKGINATIFKLIKPQIDSNNKRRADGNKGGRPVTSGLETEKPVVIENENQWLLKNKPNVNVNVNVNDNVNVNEEREEYAHETFEPNVIYTSPETETEEQRKVAPKKSNYVLLGKDEVVRRIKEDESQTKEYAVFQLNLSNDEFLLSVDMFVGEKGEDGLKRDYGEILKHYRSWLKLNIKIIKNLSKNGNKTQEKYFGIPTDSLKRTHDALLNS